MTNTYTHYKIIQYSDYHRVYEETDDGDLVLIIEDYN